SKGVVPFLKVVNDTAVAVNQGGKRKGAVCAYLETWHMDIEEFIELRKNTGDDRRRTHDMNTANWIPDLFMKRVFDDGPWTLFSPSEVPDLHDLTGKAFQERYEYYEALTEYPGKIKLFKTIQAKDLWRKMLSMLFETGHPWLTFKDPCNLRSPQQHVGVVHSSNLCTEITLNTNKDEIAVCNLGSINLPNHIVDGKLDTDKLKRTVDVAVRMLDNVIDINYYSVPQAKNSNLRHRPVGLGIMGFQDALYLQHIPYGSDAAVQFADTSMEAVSYYAIQASCDLADERGAYETFQGSLWSKGILPLDSQQILIEQRGEK
ncbi:ribonucleotide-diphosphate reductase subunit alpha, partial [Pseudomonas syringae pv. pisi str. 1704B]